mgnify:CR=1 FL=1
MTLKQKVDMYQRKEMVDGLMMPDTDKHKQTRAILDNKEAYEKGMTAADMYQASKQEYLNFLSDPKRHFKQMAASKGKKSWRGFGKLNDDDS